jgi:hypothetical protein
MRCANLSPKALLLLSLVLVAATGGAAPVRCSWGYQDSTCTAGLARAPAPAPTCSTDPGWTTASPARWIGSQYSAPQCNYQAPPSCPTGYTQTAAPSWNGSNWVGLGCAVPPPASATPVDLATSCNTYAAGLGFSPYPYAHSSTGDSSPIFLASDKTGGGAYVSNALGPAITNTAMYQGSSIYTVQCNVTSSGTVTQFLYNALSGYDGG